MRTLAESRAAFRAVFASRGLRNLQLAWAASIVAHCAYGVAVAVYAYESGGAEAVALVYVLRMVPSALVSPFAGTLADRYRRERVMLLSDVSRACLVAGAAAAVFAHASPGFVYALTTVIALAATPFGPARAALAPSLARDPGELTAANVAASTIESVGFFVGPAIAGLLLSVTGTGVVLLVTTLGFLWSGFCLSRIETEAQPAAHPRISPRTILSESREGFRIAAGDPRLRVLLGLFTAQTLVAGGLSVLVVVTAIELLDLGRSGVGFLNSAFGVGALVGAVFSFALVGIRRLSTPFVAGVLLWGLPLVVVGIWPSTVAAVVLLGLIGVGNTLVDVSGFTLVQRAVPDYILARVFGVMEMLWLGSMGLGAVIAAPIVDGLGARAGLIAVGAFLPALLLLVGMRVAAIDAVAKVPTEELELLRRVPIFAPLPGAPLEHLAGRLIPLELEPGAEIIRQDEVGNLFYVIAEGEVEVSSDGVPVATLGQGDYFGEIALLRDVPRTATVTARTPVVLYALERPDFLAAVMSHAPSSSAADSVVGTRLAGLSAARAT
jgi:MFS family permease